MARDMEKKRAYNMEYMRKKMLDKNFREEKLAKNKVWAESNPDKMLSYRGKWRKNNPGRCASYSARYRARKLNQTPENANKIWIDLIYEHCPEGHHVDHIVALVNGGLHHEDNLQYLTASENCSKGDR